MSPCSVPSVHLLLLILTSCKMRGIIWPQGGATLQLYNSQISTPGVFTRGSGAKNAIPFHERMIRIEKAACQAKDD